MGGLLGALDVRLAQWLLPGQDVCKPPKPTADAAVRGRPLPLASDFLPAVYLCICGRSPVPARAGHPLPAVAGASSDLARLVLDHQGRKGSCGIGGTAAASVSGAAPASGVDEMAANPAAIVSLGPPGHARMRRTVQKARPGRIQAMVAQVRPDRSWRARTPFLARRNTVLGGTEPRSLAGRTDQDHTARATRSVRRRLVESDLTQS